MTEPNETTEKSFYVIIIPHLTTPSDAYQQIICWKEAYIGNNFLIFHMVAVVSEMLSVNSGKISINTTYAIKQSDVHIV